MMSRTQYDKLILIDKREALAFATNAALLQSATDGRFKLFVNGDRTKTIKDEQVSLSLHQISYTSEHIKEILKATEGSVDIIEVPYSTMHGSGGSVRCTVQEVACSAEAVNPHKASKYYFSQTLDKFEERIDNRNRRIRRNQLFYGESGMAQSNKLKESTLKLDNHQMIPRGCK